MKFFVCSRIRENSGVSMKGIRVLANPATIGSHRSEYSLCTLLWREKRQC